MTQAIHALRSSDHPPVETPRDLRTAMRLLDRAATGSGALLCYADHGVLLGSVLMERGRVCWATCKGCEPRLAELLVAAGQGLTLAEASEVVAQHRRALTPWADDLVARQRITLSALRRVLLRHTAEAFGHLATTTFHQWSWTAHAPRPPHPMLSFSAMEVLVSMAELRDPGRAERALAMLQGSAGSTLRGFALQRAAGGCVPVAQLACEDLDATVLHQLARQAEDTMSGARVAGIRAAVVELDQWCFAAWEHEETCYVLLCDDGLRFNRLLAQVAGLV